MVSLRCGIIMVIER